jgi:hypothetical protein
VSTTDRYRYILDIGARRIDMHTPENEVVPIYDLMPESAEKLLALAFLGVKQHINQNVTRRRAKGSDADKATLIREIAVELQNKTAESMHQRGRPKANEGPRILKRDRIAALAAMKGCTVTALTEALNRVDPEKAEAVLHSPEVEAYIATQQESTAEL